SSFKLIRPSEALDGLENSTGGQVLRLESSEQPIPVKKQGKYNINRWALTGRDDLGINTKCYKIYDAFRKAKENKPEKEDWRELCFLWSSDFRTHITEKRWTSYLTRLDRFCEKWQCEEGNGLVKAGGKVIKPPYSAKTFKVQDDTRHLTIETESVQCVLNKMKGLVMSALRFKNIFPAPLIGTLPHGYYEDISLGADFYSGHTIIEMPGEHKITDLQVCEPEVTLRGTRLLSIRTELDTEGVTFKKEYDFDLFGDTVAIKLDIEIPNRTFATIHPLNITFIPTSFQQGSLFYATHNGGQVPERFDMGSFEINHAQSLSILVSAQQGLGATEGLVIIGDEQRQLMLYHEQGKSAMIPTIHFLPMNGGKYFLRLQYSAQEMDETFRESAESVRIQCGLRISPARYPL
ncbi:MAG: glycoside hydrolase family 57, partial [Pseudomonadota bacterium]